MLIGYFFILTQVKRAWTKYFSFLKIIIQLVLIVSTITKQNPDYYLFII